MAGEVAWACLHLHLSILRLKTHSLSAQSWLSAFISPVQALPGAVQPCSGSSQAVPVRGPRWTHTPRSLCTAAAAPPAVMLGLLCAVGMQFGYSPLRMGELGSCSRDVKPTCSQILSREGGCYRSAAEETAGTTPSNICRFWFYCHSFCLLCCLLKVNLHRSCRLSYWTNCKHPSYLYTL